MTKKGGKRWMRSRIKVTALRIKSVVAECPRCTLIGHTSCSSPSAVIATRFNHNMTFQQSRSSRFVSCRFTHHIVPYCQQYIPSIYFQSRGDAILRVAVTLFSESPWRYFQSRSDAKGRWRVSDRTSYKVPTGLYNICMASIVYQVCLKVSIRTFRL